jgi:hypothetical protein
MIGPISINTNTIPKKRQVVAMISPQSCFEDDVLTSRPGLVLPSKECLL